MSDIWEIIYGASALNPNADTDGDGASNIQEATAGTNPFDATSFPAITGAIQTSPSFNVTLPCALGKQYALQSVTVLGATNWFVETNFIVRSGTNVTLYGANSNITKFFRVAISDVDTDGDGLNDWEEYKLGLDPLNPYSNGQLDGNGNLLNDYQYVVGKLASENVFTISATISSATQPAPGQSASGPGTYTVTRGGFALNAVTVSLALGGPGPGFAVEGVDHSVLPRSVYFPATASSVNINLTPLADTNLLAPVIAMMSVLPGTNYTVGQSSNASVVIYPCATATGTGLTGLYFTNSSVTYTNSANFNPANLKMTRIDPTVDFIWGTTTNPITNNGYYCVRWIGQVQPQFSETYYFDANTDDGVKLWVNDQLIINNWVSKSASDSIGSITLQAGVRYDIKMEYFQVTSSAVAHLSWYSPSQSKQIIPSSQLYPTNGTTPPTAITSSLTTVAFVGQPFSYTVTAANSPVGFTALGLPPGLAFNSTNGVISGVPALAGVYQVSLTASNAFGVGASAVAIQVISNGLSVVQEIWTGVPGTNIADIPLTTPANLTNTLSTLEGITDYGNNYAERIRGYFTAPATGTYYFWIAGSDSAELWISDDDDQVNQMRRSLVAPSANASSPPAMGTGSRAWSAQTNQQSPWLSLVAGQNYFIEILHKVGMDTSNNWSVGWLPDPAGTNTVPAGVVPSYLLSPYYPLPLTVAPGTLYSANMLPLPGITSTAYGSATLLVNSAGTQATLKFAINNLSSSVTSQHIDSDPYLTNSSQLIYDISQATPQSDGSYLWNIRATGTLQIADILQIISEGLASINIHTANNPGGELSGHFTLANGSQVLNPSLPPPAWTDDHTNANAAARFLIQATFGPSPSDIALVQSIGYSNWIANQFSLPATHFLPAVMANTNSDPTQPYNSSIFFSTWWQDAVTAPDQLRQRVAFALSEIMVVSENGVLGTYYANCLASYYDTLLDNAFGNYRNLLQSVTLAPAMGLYLNVQGNAAGNIITGVHADENYAREVMQLFSIGLNRLWPDGTQILNAQGLLVPTYNQNTIMGFASVFTGWNYYQTNLANGRLPSNWYPAANYTNPMVLVPTQHETGTKQLLDNIMLPAAQGLQTNAALTNFDTYGEQDLNAALNVIFNNPNVGPVICRELIQRLVTSNPSRDYVYRVTQVFNNDGTGVRGNLQAVVQAILLDYEARSPSASALPDYGKQREALLRVTAPARAFPAPPPNGGTYTQNGTQTITVTTTNVHLMNSGDTADLTFTDTSGQPAPPMQGYSVTVTNPSIFTITAPGLLVGTYGQTNGILTAALSGHGLTTNYPAYLYFTTGGASNGIYTVLTSVDTSHFTAATADTNTRSGACLLPKLTGGGYVVTSKTNLSVSTSMQHGLTAGANVFLTFNNSGSPSNGLYQIASVPAPNVFTAIVPSTNNQTEDSLTTYPMQPPVLTRSGTIGIQESTWNMGYTDSGSSSSLSMTPLRSPTVFNYYYPNYMFPGAIAAAGMTTPEFQLTSDSTVAQQMNFLEGGLLNNSGNTNGLSSFASGNGSIVLDIAPWMTTNYTSAAGVPALVDSLNSLLTAGQLSALAKTNIVTYVTNVTNFPFSAPPTASQMRDRVRAVIHQFIVSPDYTIQR